MEEMSLQIRPNTPNEQFLLNDQDFEKLDRQQLAAKRVVVLKNCRFDEVNLDRLSLKHIELVGCQIANLSISSLIDLQTISIRHCEIRRLEISHNKCFSECTIEKTLSKFGKVLHNYGRMDSMIHFDLFENETKKLHIIYNSAGRLLLNLHGYARAFHLMGNAFDQIEFKNSDAPLGADKMRKA